MHFQDIGGFWRFTLTKQNLIPLVVLTLNQNFQTDPFRGEPSSVFGSSFSSRTQFDPQFTNSLIKSRVLGSIHYFKNPSETPKQPHTITLPPPCVSVESRCFLRKVSVSSDRLSKRFWDNPDVPREVRVLGVAVVGHFRFSLFSQIFD